jgi:tetratricopeptide (TPR) repeat protein
VLCLLARNEEAIATYEEAVRRFGEDPDPALRELVAAALVSKGATLGDLDRNEEAIATYEEIVRRFGEDTDLPVRTLVARALDGKDVLLRENGGSDEAIIANDDEIVRRFVEDPDPALRERAARALFGKFVLGQEEEGTAALEEIVRRFGEETEPGISGYVETAVKALKNTPGSELWREMRMERTLQRCRSFKLWVIALGAIAVAVFALLELIAGKWVAALLLFFVGEAVWEFVADIVTGVLVSPFIGAALFFNRRR